MSFLDRFKRKGQEETTPPVSPPKAPEAPPSAPRPSSPSSPQPGKAIKPDLAMLKPDSAMEQAAAKAAADAIAQGYNPEFILPQKKGKPAEPARPTAGSGGSADRPGDSAPSETSGPRQDL